MYEKYLERIQNAYSLFELDMISEEFIDDEALTNKEFTELCFASWERISELGIFR